MISRCTRSVIPILPLCYLIGFFRMWGLSAIYAYRSYKDEQFLNIAINVWEDVGVYMITPQEAGSGSHPKKSGSFLGFCSGGE